MGNNPSRTSHHHPHHPHHPQQSASSSASASPPSAATRSAITTVSSRHPGFRRNSLQSPASAKYGVATSQEFLTPARPQPPSSHDHHNPHSRYHTPLPGPQRRESIATTIPEGSGYHTFPTRTREELLEDAATLRLFPTPPMGVNVQPTSPSPFAPNVNPFAPSAGAAGKQEMPPAPGMRQGRGSMESTAASIEDEVLAPQECDDARSIPTLIQWPHPGTKVYVTGTFCAWEKRYRLTKKYVPPLPVCICHSCRSWTAADVCGSVEDKIMSAVVAIPPGTHHVKFLIDGEMRTSPSLPTAVDDTGILVNYLEVSADDMPPLNRQLSTDSAGGTPSAPSDRIPSAVPAEAPLRYTTEIPAYLKEFSDAYEEDPSGGGYADGAPPPPSLPMMLQKVILNTGNATKDDASVLGIPNHAVLNHLATSSIKNSILAVSATTRYKKKVCFYRITRRSGDQSLTSWWGAVRHNDLVQSCVRAGGIAPDCLLGCDCEGGFLHWFGLQLA